MRILSCLNGIGSWRAALEQTEIPMDVFFSSETNQIANAIVSLKYPDVYQLGDVYKLRPTDTGKIDLLVAALPYQDLKKPGKKLFHKIENLIEELKPKYFIIEHSCKSKDNSNAITQALFTEPVIINANRFSPQNRNKSYWFNFPLTYPVPSRDHKTMLADVLLPDREERIIRNEYPDIEWEILRAPIYESGIVRVGYVKSGLPGVTKQHSRIVGPNGKAPTLLCSQRSANRVKIFHKDLNDVCWLAITEAERLQGFPDDHTLFSRLGITSDCSRIKLIGNSCSVPVLKFLLDNLWIYEQQHS